MTMNSKNNTSKVMDLNLKALSNEELIQKFLNTMEKDIGFEITCGKNTGYLYFKHRVAHCAKLGITDIFNFRGLLIESVYYFKACVAPYISDEEFSHIDETICGELLSICEEYERRTKDEDLKEEKYIIEIPSEPFDDTMTDILKYKG